MMSAKKPGRQKSGVSFRIPNRQTGSIRKPLVRWIAGLSALALTVPVISALQQATTGSNLSSDENRSRSIAIADLDLDGNPDVVVANEADTRNQVFWGDGAGGFSAGQDLDGREENSDSVDFGDVNNDGYLDIVIGNRSSSQPNVLYLNNQNRTFTARTDTSISDDEMEPRATSSVRFALLNNDNEPDLVVANRDTKNVVFIGNVGAGIGFANRLSLNQDGPTDTSSVAVGDLNNDGNPDIIFGNRRNQRNVYFLNNSSSGVPFQANGDTFFYTDPSLDRTYTDWVEVADLNNDGWDDVVFANRLQPNTYLINKQTVPPTFENPMQVSSDADYTRDLRLVDVDGDGDIDVIAANDRSAPNKLYLNQLNDTGTLGFSDGIAITNDTFESIALGVCDPNDSRALRACDLDGDSDIDLVVANNRNATFPAESFVNRVYLNNNETPVFSSSPITSAAEGAAYTYNIVATDGDSGDTLTITAPTLPAWLAAGFTDNGDGTATLTAIPAAGESANGAQTVELQVADGNGGTATQNFTVTALAGASAPVITSSAPTSIDQNGDTLNYYTITATDADAGETLTFSAPGAPGFISIFDGDGSRDTTPAGDGTAVIAVSAQQNDIGSYGLTFRVTDSTGLTDEEGVTLAVNDGNDRPQPVDDVIQASPGATVTMFPDSDPGYGSTTLLYNDSDPDGDSLTMDTVPAQGPTAGTLTLNPAGNGTFEYVNTNTSAASDTFRYRVRDGNGRANTATVTINLSGNNAPVANDDAYSVEQGGSNLGTENVLDNDTDPDPGTTLMATLGTPPANAAVFMLNPDGTFTYTHDGSATTADSFTYVADDGFDSSNTATVNLTITPDTTPPVITLTGDAVVTVDVFSTYTDAGATATDAVDGDVTANIVTVNPVDTDVPGSYTVTYNVSDAAGNAAVEVTRTVNVVDNVAPVITLLGDAAVTVSAGSTYTDAGATASDNVDGDLTANIATVNPVNTAVPGNYTVTYDVQDSSGNAAAQVTRAVTVVDDQAPVITLNGDATVTQVVGGTYTDAGATASDNVDGDISGNIMVGGDTVDPNTIGSYTITYDVSDAAGNAAMQVSRTVQIVPADMTPPVITVNGDVSVSLFVGQTYTDAGATATDDTDGNVPVMTDNPVDTTTAGTYTVTYTATDSSGNTAMATRTVTVNVDDVAPVITLNGDATVTLTEGDTYTDAGATATDNVDGDLTSAITTDNPVDANTAGTYTVTYTVSDAAGNMATADRTVTVNAATPPPPPPPPPQVSSGGGGAMSAPELLGMMLLLMVGFIGRKSQPIRRST